MIYIYIPIFDATWSRNSQPHSLYWDIEDLLLWIKSIYEVYMNISGCIKLLCRIRSFRIRYSKFCIWRSRMEWCRIYNTRSPSNREATSIKDLISMKDGPTQRSIFCVNEATGVKWTVALCYSVFWTMFALEACGSHRLYSIRRNLYAIIDRVLYRPSPNFSPNSMFVAALLLLGRMTLDHFK